MINIGLFKKRCWYCTQKIEKGQEEFRGIKGLEYVGTVNKPFCSKKHADSYEEDLKNRPPQIRSCCH